MGTLYLVASPIGNLEDMTLRALRLLSEVNLIAAEDTRRARKLLSHYKIETPVLSYHEHSKSTRLDQLLDALAAGDVALLSEAGMPGLSDPGYELIVAAWESGHRVSPIPGASAPVAGLVASGLPTDSFLYLGYLPRREADRRRLLQSIARQPRTVVAFEAPHRLVQSLDDLDQVLGADRRIAVCRELTKLHEEILRGSVAQIREHFSRVKPRGEFTLVIGGALESSRWEEEAVREALARRLAEGMKPSSAAKAVALEAGWPRREVYRIALEES